MPLRRPPLKLLCEYGFVQVHITYLTLHAGMLKYYQAEDSISLGSYPSYEAKE